MKSCLRRSFTPSAYILISLKNEGLMVRKSGDDEMRECHCSAVKQYSWMNRMRTVVRLAIDYRLSGERHRSDATGRVATSLQRRLQSYINFT